MMEREWASLTTEEFILIKHCNLSRADVMNMTGEERAKYISLLKEEREQEERASKGMNRASPQQLPSRG